MYKKLHRISTHGYVNYIPNFKETFPELSKLTSEELSDRFEQLNLEFYTEEKKPTPALIRITLPLAVVVIIIMVIGLPIRFMITGRWGYSFGKSNIIHNWLRALKIES